MIEHVGVRDKSVCFVTLDLDAENAACNHHAHFRVLFDGEHLVFGDFLADQIVVSLNVFNFVGDLHLEGTTVQPFTLFFRVEYWEICETLGEDVDVLNELAVSLAPLLHQQSGQERVLGANKSLPEIASCHLGPYRRGHSHIES